ncbi:MAG: hypothetical protein AAGI23_14125 [Bacteroidota bacterium]|jgi:hypothetical protein
MRKKRKSISSYKGKDNEISKDKQDKLKGGKKNKKWGRGNSCGNIVPQ